MGQAIVRRPLIAEELVRTRATQNVIFDRKTVPGTIFLEKLQF
jgi:hypothetical protein